MSETQKDNSNETGAPKKKSRKGLLIVGLLLLLIAGAGSAAGFYFWSKSKTAEKAEAAEEEEAPKEKKSAEEKTPIDESVKQALPDDSKVKTVVELQPFIVNLADADEARYLRMTVSLGMGEEGGEKADPIFLTRVKNAMLAVLTTKKSEDVLTVEGKTKLRQELLGAAQAASSKPKVHAIYITDFIVQL